MVRAAACLRMPHLHTTSSWAGHSEQRVVVGFLADAAFAAGGPSALLPASLIRVAAGAKLGQADGMAFKLVFNGLLSLG